MFAFSIIYNILCFDIHHIVFDFYSLFFHLLAYMQFICHSTILWNLGMQLHFQNKLKYIRNPDSSALFATIGKQWNFMRGKS